MKVIGFVGSPRKNGNTDFMVQQILKGAAEEGAETKIFYLNELNIKGCQSCNYCKEKGKCRQQDDMTPLYDEIASADGIVIGSPVYMGYMSGQAKLFIDRWYAFFQNPVSSLEQGKKIALVFCQMNPDETSYNTTFTSLGQMLSSLFGLELKGILVAGGMKDAETAQKNNELRQKALTLGKQLAR